MKDTTPCTGCGKPVVWIRTRANKPMPLDPEAIRCVPYKKGDPLPDAPVRVLMVVDDEGRTFKARTTVPGEPCKAVGRQSHFATCVKAATFRAPK